MSVSARSDCNSRCYILVWTQQLPVSLGQEAVDVSPGSAKDTVPILC